MSAATAALARILAREAYHCIDCLHEDGETVEQWADRVAALIVSEVGEP